MSAQEYRKLRGELADRDNQGHNAKYLNTICEIDGISFQSRKEGKFYGQCKMRILAGELTKIEMQQPFDLAVNGKHIAKYIADFVLYYADGRVEVIDVKSDATRVIGVYRIKKALMFAIHKIQVIEK